VLAQLGPVLMTFAVTLLSTVLLLWAWPSMGRSWTPLPVLAGLVGGVVAVHLVLPERSLLPCLVAGALLTCGACGYAAARPALRGAGAAVWIVWLVFGATGALWGLSFLSSLHLSAVTMSLVWVGVGLGALTVPSAIVTTREGWEPLLRSRWDRPRDALLRVPPRQPRVSIHLPCHSEPPHIVIATLNRLAALDYANFEVLVVDNNTSDPRLWEPVRDHCDELGDRFRFFHIDGITGAKAGALNWALRRTDPAAELIGVVDADYQVEPHWLVGIVGYFDDPRMGFVQCPHAYRDFEHSRFGRWANSEYSVFFNAGMVSLNEHNAGLTVGTMSLIRRQALVQAGGWAEWCLTEDSELAIRVHAAGYDSVYLTEPYGRGLIPDTFAAYRRQRFRWTFGPVQEIRRHWRLFLPRWAGATPSRLSRAQKLHHANHGIDVLAVGLRALSVPIAGAVATSMLVHHEHVPVPVELWAASTSVLISSLILRYLVYTRVAGATMLEAVGGTVAFAALSLVITIASLKSALGCRAAWHRTGKFATTRRGLAVLHQVKSETVAALACTVGAVLLVAFAPLGGVITMLAIALLMQAAALFAAALVAVTADRALPSGRHTPVAAHERERDLQTVAAA
jgi:cellulose synthase/poly-beta-1,6-N-acetylglucosamine synthase-like glycosyltransferase